MFNYSQLKLILIIIILKVVLYSFIHANEDNILRYKRAIGGESLDTSNFILYTDPNGTRFIEVPEDYMNNWLDDQKMWRRWSIILAILCLIFFIILLIFLIHGFRTSTGPFATCKKHFNHENSSDDKLASTSVMTIPTDYTQVNTVKTSLPSTYRTNPLHLSALQSSAHLPLK